MGIDMSTAVIAAVSAFGGALLTFFTANRDSVSKANETAINSLLITIQGMTAHSEMLEARMKRLDIQLEDVGRENHQLSEEIRKLRHVISEYQLHCAHIGCSDCPIGSADMELTDVH